MQFIKKPCVECPWRKDAQQGRFTRERWDTLQGTVRGRDAAGRPTGPEFGSMMFACHITKEGQEQACAGWLAVEGAGHPTVRYAVATGSVPACALSPQEGWPELHESYDETRRHDLMEND